MSYWLIEQSPPGLHTIYAAPTYLTISPDLALRFDSKLEAEEYMKRPERIYSLPWRAVEHGD